MKESSSRKRKANIILPLIFIFLSAISFALYFHFMGQNYDLITSDRFDGEEFAQIDHFKFASIISSIVFLSIGLFLMILFYIRRIGARKR